MGEYRLKTPKTIEKTVVSACKKTEESVVGTYRKIEDRFVGAFLEKTGDPDKH